MMKLSLRTSRIRACFGCLALIVGAPLVAAGVIAMRTLCGPWSSAPGSFATWSVLDSTLLCCNSSCPEVVVLNGCSWRDRNMSQWGSDCVVGHIPDVEWCWSDDRCYLGDYADVSLGIAFLCFGSLLSGFALCVCGLQARTCASACGDAADRWRQRREQVRAMAIVRRRASVFLVAASEHSCSVDSARFLPTELRLRVLDFYLPPLPGTAAAAEEGDSGPEDGEPADARPLLGSAAGAWGADEAAGRGLTGVVDRLLGPAGWRLPLPPSRAPPAP
eukprot:TRINITY_DN60813_c0_g1_i1.p1 TRINITY_DN60813_c0_g1~~TRINITY_DN60813_c0_g1_i1.p1  ORF type:complete len:308 (+),score=44.55 TRINITY_DN60813_c0_g1_i1:102-926(+)